MVRDPADTLDGIRAVFPQFIEMAKRLDRDPALRERCSQIVNVLPDPPRGHWGADSKIDPGADEYAPAAALGKFAKRANAENPQLYRVYPFGLSGIGTPDFDLAKRTFDRRICVLWNGWSMDAIWAARLGLGEQARDLAVQHAKMYNRFRYGGWDSNDSRGFPDRLAVAPFLDAGGLNAFALQEMLLQSHNGVVRVLPAVAKAWSGIFRLRAEGGFLVAAAFEGGRPRFVEVRSLLGGDCTLANPWAGRCILREGGKVLRESDQPTITFKTRTGATVLLEPADRPVTGLRPTPIEDRPNASPGLPGRDRPDRG